MNLFETLTTIAHRPDVWSKYTASQLWADPYIATQMLKFHLNPDVDAASRNEPFINESVEWLISRFALANHSKVIDFGCGPGLYTSRLAQQGITVTGVDFSANSLSYAKNCAEENSLNIQYVEQNYLEFETEDKFDLVTMIMCDFCALSPRQRAKLLKKWERILTCDGSIVLDVHTNKAFGGQNETATKDFGNREETMTVEPNFMNGFWAPCDYYGFLNVFKYPEEKVILEKYTIVLPEEERVIYNWLQYFTLEALTEEVEAQGLRIDSVYNDIRGEQYSEVDEMAVVLRRA
ncbi:class I SAM-dependent methyltransferase [Halodesulfovibrio sp. MK-HDV]|jgi:SAM-dependent methyltransferase|uniref:class I SAM-dependent methyltransferase n=1 Tax=Halodesulfovibrio sp. MK-HDV TaxID=2599925 RepID=UPI0013696CC5|nr:class I SAM-dependent methyltransferase [Halodesulfovibrio sp. MK-HDV]KAF1075113.1 Cypemycin N-terminal methyltransferase [Halodesulfovibrio sp. MK-HDV]